MEVMRPPRRGPREGDKSGPRCCLPQPGEDAAESSPVTQEVGPTRGYPGLGLGLPARARRGSHRPGTSRELPEEARASARARLLLPSPGSPCFLLSVVTGPKRSLGLILLLGGVSSTKVPSAQESRSQGAAPAQGRPRPGIAAVLDRRRLRGPRPPTRGQGTRGRGLRAPAGLSQDPAAGRRARRP